MSGFEVDFEFDGEGLDRAFADAGAELTERLVDALATNGKALRNDWRDNARATARRHGKHYPSSITVGEVMATGGALSVDVGPDKALPQGRMGEGFEYGSVHQPPHMDGARAFARNAPQFERAVDDAVARSLRGLG